MLGADTVTDCCQQTMQKLKYSYSAYCTVQILQYNSFRRSGSSWNLLSTQNNPAIWRYIGLRPPGDFLWTAETPDSSLQDQMNSKTLSLLYS